MLVKAKITATVTVIRSRFFSTTVEPAAAEPTEPPNMSDSPPPLPRVHEDEEDERQAAEDLEHDDDGGQHGKPPPRGRDHRRRYQTQRRARAAARTISTNSPASRLAPPTRSAVDVGAGHELLGVVRLDRSPVLDPDPGGLVLAHLGATTPRIQAQASWASSGVAAWPVPMAQMGS